MIDPATDHTPAGHTTALIHLEDTSTGVWRRFRVPTSIRLDRFARVLRIILDQQDPGDYSFTTPDSTVRPGAAQVLDPDVRVAEALTLAGLESEIVQFDYAPHITVHLRILQTTPDSEEAPIVCLDGWGQFGTTSATLEEINRELAAERWVDATLSRVKSSLQDLINRTGMWESAQLIAYALGDPEHAPRYCSALEQRRDLLAPLQDMLHDANENQQRLGPQDRAHPPVLEHLHLVNSEGNITPKGQRCLDDPDALWTHVARSLPLEREITANDAAWLNLLTLTAGLPRGSSETFIMQGMIWAGHRGGRDEVLVTDDIRSRCTKTAEVLEACDIISDERLTLGGPTHAARMDLLRDILRR